MSFPQLPSPLSATDGPPLEISSTAGDSAERKRRNSRLGSMSNGTTSMTNVSSPLGSGMSSSTLPDGSTKEVGHKEPGNSWNGRRVLDADALRASLPPQLAALRAGVPGRVPIITQPTAASNAARRMSQPGSGGSESASSSTNVSPRNSFTYGSGPVGQNESGSDGPSTRNQAAKRLSMMALTPSSNGNPLGRLSLDGSAIASDGEQTGSSPIEIGSAVRRRGSASSFTAQRDPPILSHDSKCSGYFVEPVSRSRTVRLIWHHRRL
jgi:hypothetical protein